MRKQYAIHNKPGFTLRAGLKADPVVDRRSVRVMAEAEGYAMVRRKGAMPYVAPIRELQFVAKKEDADKAEVAG